MDAPLNSLWKKLALFTVMGERPPAYLVAEALLEIEYHIAELERACKNT